MKILILLCTLLAACVTTPDESVATYDDEPRCTVDDCPDPAPAPRPPSTPAPVASCAQLGCPVSPSGSPDQWSPCTGEACYCGNPAVACER